MHPDSHCGWNNKRVKMLSPSARLLKRINMNPEILAGKPVIKGTRLSVQFILGLLAHEGTPQSIIGEYHYISEEDIRACLLFDNEILDSNFFTPLDLFK